MTNLPYRHQGTGDRIGIGATLLCVIHCLMLPVLLPIATTVGLGILVSAAGERVMLLATLLLAYVVLRNGRRYHHRQAPLILAGLGGLLYAGKQLAGEAWEPLLVVVGGMLIIAAHVLNLRLCLPQHPQAQPV